MSSMASPDSAWSAAHRRSTEARRARYSAIIWFTPKPSSARLRPWLLAADSGLVACAVRPCALSRCSAALCGVRRSATMSRRISGMSLRRRLWFNCAPSGAWVMAKSTASSRMRCMLAWMKSGSRISTSCCSFCVVWSVMSSPWDGMRGRMSVDEGARIARVVDVRLRFRWIGTDRHVVRIARIAWHRGPFRRRRTLRIRSACPGGWACPARTACRATWAGPAVSACRVRSASACRAR